jgi:hypothetical protein
VPDELTKVGELVIFLKGSKRYVNEATLETRSPTEIRIQAQGDRHYGPSLQYEGVRNKKCANIRSIPRVVTQTIPIYQVTLDAWLTTKPSYTERKKFKGKKKLSFMDKVIAHANDIVHDILLGQEPQFNVNYSIHFNNKQ